MNLENVIDARLKLQTTQRQLDEYGIDIRSAKGLKTQKFAKVWAGLSDQNKRYVIGVLGGWANRQQTENYMQEILEGVTV